MSLHTQAHLSGVFVGPCPFTSRYLRYRRYLPNSGDLLSWSPNTLLPFFSGVATWLVTRCGIDSCPVIRFRISLSCGLSNVRWNCSVNLTQGENKIFLVVFFKTFLSSIDISSVSSYLVSSKGCVRRRSASSSYSWGTFIKCPLNFPKNGTLLGFGENIIPHATCWFVSNFHIPRLNPVFH